MKKILILPIFVLTGLLFQGCVSIPQEAPTLSQELGNQISSLENANLTLLHRFFDIKRAEVDRFIEEKWVPLFAKNFFSDPKMTALWDKVIQSGDPAEKLNFFIKVGPKLQQEINTKRLVLVAPLDQLERLIADKIRREYANARSINNSITSFLVSAAKVDESRRSYLDMVGVTEDKITNAINKTDNLVTQLLAKAKKAEDVADGTEMYLKEANKLKDSLFGSGEK